MDLSTKAGRIAYGKEAEKAVANILKKNNVTYELTEDKKPNDFKYDMENGDIFIASPWGNKVIRADVKRSSISLNSIKNFKGEAFILTDNNMQFFIAFPAGSMKKYMDTCLKKGSGTTKLASGDWGIKLNPRKLVHLYRGKFINNWIEDKFNF